MFKKILLLGFLTIMISVIMVSAYEDKFPRISYSPPYMTSDSTYNQYFAQAVDTLHFTGLIQNAPLFKDVDFSAAKSHRLNLVNAGITYFASSGQYSMYQADGFNDWDWIEPSPVGERFRFLSTKYYNAGHGRQYGDSTANNGYAWYVSRNSANDNRGYVLCGLGDSLGTTATDYRKEQDRDSSLIYYVVFKLKVPSISVNDTVANLEVHFYKRGETDSVLAEKLLRYGDFSDSTGRYNSYILTFARPPYDTADYFDYKVYWYKQTDLYIDYVEVYDHIYNLLFNVPDTVGSTITVLERQLMNDSTMKFLEERYHDSSLYRWLLTDEPTYDQYKSSRKVIEILADKVHKPAAYVTGIQSTGDFDNHNSYRYMEEVNSHELWYDDYPTYLLPPGDNNAFQLALDMYADRLSKVTDAVNAKGKEWWYVAPTFQKSIGDSIIFRYPHNSELKSFVYLALAYGAKGIGYFQYADRSYSDGVHGGLVTPTGAPIQTYSYKPYYNQGAEYLFDAVKDINQKLDTLGPILQKLEWKWAGPSQDVQSAPGSFVSSVSADSCIYCCQCVCKGSTPENHIQIGLFKDTTLAEDYFMLVNRWVGRDDLHCTKVTLQKDRGSYLFDCLTGQMLGYIGSTDSFHVLLEPGQGKLFRLANFLISTLSVSRQRNPQRFNLSWTDPNSGESGYQIKRRSASVDSFSVIKTTGSNVTTYQDTLTPLGSETYYYRVRAFYQQYYSGYSNTVAVKAFPYPPRNLTGHLNRICCPGRGGAAASGIGINGICPYCYTNEIILSWQQPDPSKQKSGTVTSYRIRSWQGSTLKDSMTVSSQYTSTTFCVPQLGTSYTFKVYALDYAGDISDSSNRVTITSGTTENCNPGGGEPQNKIVAQVIPEKYDLFQNYPNPCNAGTQIRYALPQESVVRLVIYNILGQKVRDLVEDLQEPGYYTISWDGRNNKGEAVGSGIYFYRIQAGDFTKTAKMSLLK